MKFLLFVLLACPFSWAEDQDKAAMMKELNRLKGRVEELEKKGTGHGFKSTDYESKTTESTGPSKNEAPAMTEEQRKEIQETVEKYKKAQIEQEKVLKELEDEE